MKRVLILFLSLFLLSSLCACSEGEDYNIPEIDETKVVEKLDDEEAKEEIKYPVIVDFEDGKAYLFQEIPEKIEFKDGLENGRFLKPGKVLAYTQRGEHDTVVALCEGGFVLIVYEGNSFDKYLDGWNIFVNIHESTFSLEQYPFPEDFGAEAFVGAPIITTIS